MMRRKTKGFVHPYDGRKSLNLMEQGYARKAPYKPIDKEELWGATFIVRILPKPVN
jgi:hypothetical protein